MSEIGTSCVVEAALPDAFIFYVKGLVAAVVMLATAPEQEP